MKIYIEGKKRRPKKKLLNVIENDMRAVGKMRRGCRKSR
jgi:hypothetical protein